MKQIYIIPDRNHIGESLRLAEEYHAAFEYNDFFMPDVLDDSKMIQELIRFYQGLGRDMSKDTLHGAFLDVTVHSEDRLIREASIHRMRQSMEIAQELGVRGVVFHTGRIANFLEPSYIANWKKKNAACIRELLKQYPCQEIWMENMFDEAPDILVEFAKELEDEERFGICLDYAHAALTGVDNERWVQQLAPYIRHMHINDHDGKNDLHWEIGCGSTDWKAYEEQMKRYQIHAGVLIEMNQTEHQRGSLEYLKVHKIYPFSNEGEEYEADI